MPTAVITGVMGQDGRYLADMLVQGGWTVHGITRSLSDEPASAEELGFQLHEGDLGEPAGIRSILAEVEPHAVFNLGGISSVAESWLDPYQASVVTGSAVSFMLQSAWELQERLGREVRFVQASSAEIFGNVKTVPQTECTPLAPVNPYGAAKAHAQQLVRLYRSRGLFAASAILYNHESPRRPKSFVTRKITSQVARIALEMDDSLVLGNLDARRDWGWAPDYVDALYRIGNAPSPGDYIVATGTSRSVRDFVETAFATVGVQDWERYVRTDTSYVRPIEAPELRGDASKARHELGWRPTIGFEEIVRRMIERDVALLTGDAEE